MNSAYLTGLHEIERNFFDKIELGYLHLVFRVSQGDQQMGTLRCYLDERKVKNKYVLGFLFIIDDQEEKKLHETLKTFRKTDKRFLYHATEDDAANSRSKGTAKSFKEFIQKEVAQLCLHGKAEFMRFSSSDELSAYKELIDNLDEVKMRFQREIQIHTDQVSLSNKTWSFVSPALKKRGWIMRPHRKAHAPLFIGIVDYILYYTINISNSKK